MEPESSLPHSQQPATCPYPEPQGEDRSVRFKVLTAVTMKSSVMGYDAVYTG